MRSPILFPLVVALAVSAGADPVADARGVLLQKGDRLLRYDNAGRKQWERTLAGKIQQRGDQTYVVGEQWVRLDLDSGQPRFQVDLPKELAYGPDAAGVLAGGQDGKWALERRSLEDGKTIWSVPLKGKPSVRVLLPDSRASAVQTQGDGYLVVTDSDVSTVRDGKVTWTADFAHPQVVERDGKLWIASGRQLIVGDRKLDLGGEVVLAEGKHNVLLVRKEQVEELQVLGPDLQPVWKREFLRSQKSELRETAEGVLYGHDGVFLLLSLTAPTVLKELRGPCSSYEIDELNGKTVILRHSQSQQPAVASNGSVIHDLVTRQPRSETVESFELDLDYEAILSGQGTSQMTLLPHSILIANQPPSGHTPGKPYRVDPRYPNPPANLSCVGGPGNWQWQPAANPDRAEAVFQDGHLLLSHEDGSVSELLPETGKVKWRSPRLESGSKQYAFLGDALWVQGGDFAFRLHEGQSDLKLDLRQHFNPDKTNNLICLLALSAAIGGYILLARRRKLYVRRLAALSALDEAVGRATEMGRPVLYIPGLEDIDEIQTLASLSILRHVARKTAEYDTEIVVPTRRAVVMTTAQEIVKEACGSAGRPEAYVADNIRYLTDDQFGFVVGVDGIMMRDRPAANFFFGYFYAEALILAETGFSTGAIQIAGTAVPSQLPFFVAACDYTLIGEELYAASAYLSEDPLQIGSLRGQDVGKALVMAAIVVGSLAASLGGP